MPDKFDPCMDIGTCKSMGEHPAPMMPDDNAMPQRDSTANHGTSTAQIQIGGSR